MEGAPDPSLYCVTQKRKFVSKWAKHGRHYCHFRGGGLAKMITYFLLWATSMFLNGPFVGRFGCFHWCFVVTKSVKGLGCWCTIYVPIWCRRWENMNPLEGKCCHKCCHKPHKSHVLQKCVFYDLCRCHTKRRAPPIVLLVWHWLYHIVTCPEGWVFSNFPYLMQSVSGCHTKRRIAWASPAIPSFDNDNDEDLKRCVFAAHSIDITINQTNQIIVHESCRKISSS